MTADLDILVRPDPQNLGHLLTVLVAINARYRDPAGRRIVPDASRLEAVEINLLETDFGRLDVLKSIGAGWRFHHLVDQTNTIEVEDLRLRVLALEVIIESKQVADRPKDRLALPLLRKVLELQQEDKSRPAGPIEEG